MPVDLANYAGREQAYVKHFLLDAYLEALIHKIASRYDHVVYVGGFSGPWQAAGHRSTRAVGPHAASCAPACRASPNGRSPEHAGHEQRNANPDDQLRGGDDLSASLIDRSFDPAICSSWFNMTKT